jgi:hypothetical protein
MPKLIIDSTLHEKLLTLTHAVELCDSQGRVVGRYTPVPSGRGPQISEEEIQRRKSQEGGRTLAEILADLEKRS